jgi:hypothetical protein
MTARFERDGIAKVITAHISTHEAKYLELSLPGGSRLQVQDMSIEDFIDAVELCMSPLSNERKELCRRLLYSGRLTYQDTFASTTCDIDLADLDHRWYVLEELCRLGLKLPRKERVA